MQLYNILLWEKMCWWMVMIYHIYLLRSLVILLSFGHIGITCLILKNYACTLSLKTCISNTSDIHDKLLNIWYKDKFLTCFQDIKFWLLMFNLVWPSLSLIPCMRTLKRHNLRNVSNNVTIPEGTRRLIKVNTGIWCESSFQSNS